MKLSADLNLDFPKTIKVKLFFCYGLLDDGKLWL